ncbi:MAG: transglutaminase-like domain-containing protein [Alphaproteobacteria bacterium]|nr:transglutaminase-like domain-containing protein [Alphaproteobacteria bacterium]
MHSWNLRGFIQQAIGVLLLGSVVALSTGPAISAEFSKNKVEICKDKKFVQIANYKDVSCELTSPVKKNTKALSQTFQIAKDLYSEGEEYRRSQQVFSAFLHSSNSHSDAVKQRIDGFNNMIEAARTIESRRAMAIAVNYFVNVAYGYDQEKWRLIRTIPQEKRGNSPQKTIENGLGTCVDLAILKNAIFEMLGLTDCKVIAIHQKGFKPHVLHAAVILDAENTKLVLNNYNLPDKSPVKIDRLAAGSAIPAQSFFGPGSYYDNLLAAIDYKKGVIIYRPEKKPAPSGQKPMNRQSFEKLMKSSAKTSDFSAQDQAAIHKIKLLADNLYEVRRKATKFASAQQVKKSKAGMKIKKPKVKAKLLQPKPGKRHMAYKNRMPTASPR